MPLPALPRLLTHSVLAALLATAVVVLPLAGVVACPVEEVGSDEAETDGTREVGLTVAGAAESPAEPGQRVARDRRPLTTPDHRPPRTSPADPFNDPLGSRLRC